ncbi:LacI family DNA-binding transcriptional regulator [Rhodobacter lacus]|uniref:LacI family DNA-binding transcriptional regulator n=1 Tax=Rhodobacter lacus TaxID=1641972 RepID=A0ABW5AB20_9RHOB
MTLKDLAEMLGLSPTTVSRALNGFPEVAETTRRRVEAAALAHGYRPNSQARRLATGRAMAIGHVIPLSRQNEMLNPIFGDFIAGASAVYATAGYDMVLITVADADQSRAYRALRAQGNVDGVIVQGPRAQDSRIALLSDLGLPFVVHGRASGVDLPYAHVDVNSARAFERATRFLIDLGHRRIALVNGLEEMDFALRRRRGFERALGERGLAPDPHLMLSGEMTEAQGHAAAHRLLARHDPPTAFLTSSLLSAMGVRRALWDLGLKMGRDVSILTHDDELGYFRNGAEEPIFTATRASVRAAGRRCAEILLAQIAEPGAPPVTELMEAVLVVGASTGPAPGARP